MRPLIGITCSGDGKSGGLSLNTRYAESVVEAGGLPLIIPALPGLEAKYLNCLNGIILSGGGDVDPFFFGEEPLPVSGNINPQRDAFEIELARQALVLGQPLLGICRGIQVLNIAAGGTIHQDISLVSGTMLKHAQQAPRWYPTHELNILPGSLLSCLLGNSIRVNSLHHQALNRVAEGFTVTARSKDSIVEGIEAQNGRYIIGVQFHPEDLCAHDKRFINIFKSLVEAAKGFARPV